MIIQVVAFVLTIGCWIGWVVASFASYGGGNGSRIAAVNKNPDTGSMAGILGTVLFNFGFVTTVPSWVNEKRSSVSVNKSLWTSTSLTILVFFILGVIPAIPFADVLQGPVTNTCARNVLDPSFNCPNDLMQALSGNNIAHPWSSGSAVSFLVATSVYMFPIVAVVSSIPVFSIVIKYNMIENGWSQSTGFYWGVVFPWVIGLPLVYMPQLMQEFVNFTSLIFVMFTDFVVPCALFLILLRKRFGAPPEEVPDGVHIHRAFPQRISTFIQRLVAVFIAASLFLASTIAFVQAIQQGSYDFDQQTCALVGS
jgi:hypothetical protein